MKTVTIKKVKSCTVQNTSISGKTITRKLINKEPSKKGFFTSKVKTQIFRGKS